MIIVTGENVRGICLAAQNALLIDNPMECLLLVNPLTQALQRMQLKN